MLCLSALRTGKWVTIFSIGRDWVLGDPTTFKSGFLKPGAHEWTSGSVKSQKWHTNFYIIYICIFCWYNAESFTRSSKESMILKMLKVIGKGIKINYLTEKVNCST